MSSNFSPNSFDYSECFFVEKRKSKVGLKKQLHHRRAIVNTNDHMSAFLFALLKKTVKSSKISLFPLIHISMIVWKSLAHELNKNSICIFGIPSNEYLTAVSSHITAEHDAYINFLIRIKFSLYASEQIKFFTIYRVGYGFFYIINFEPKERTFQTKAFQKPDCLAPSRIGVTSLDGSYKANKSKNKRAKY